MAKELFAVISIKGGGHVKGVDFRRGEDFDVC